MITIEQIKAARGLLDWNQEDLAAHSGISKTAINNLERRMVTARAGTMNAIQRAFEEAGVQFTEGPGVRMRGDLIQVRFLEGKDSVFRLMNDILNTLGKGEERLINGTIEGRYKLAPEDLVRYDDLLHKFFHRGIKGRKLLLHGDTNFRDPSSEYRWVSKEQFSQVPNCIYSNKYAIFLWEPFQQVLLIENEHVAKSYREHFETIWKNAKIPPAYVYKRPGTKDPETPKE